MTTASANRIPLPPIQLLTLLAVSRGEISMPGPGIDYDQGTWRPAGGGNAVTQTVEALIRKGLVRPSDKVVDDRRVAVPTAAGHEAISRAAKRGR